MSDDLPTLSVYARCPRCQTWMFVGDHSNEECQQWIALRSDPSHEHHWQLIDAVAASCIDCRTLGRVVMPNGAGTAAGGDGR